MHAVGLRYRVDYRPEPDVRTKPDIVFTRVKVAVYIDGCFWHGCPEHFIPPRNNAVWWREKIERNKARDLEATRALRDRGWRVVRHWEHEDPRQIADHVIEVVTAARL